jgi:hypothetical protein
MERGDLTKRRSAYRRAISQSANTYAKLRISSEEAIEILDCFSNAKIITIIV